jgi:hypothetical protein
MRHAELTLIHSCQTVVLTSCLPSSWSFPRNARTAIAFLLCWKRCRAESTVELGSLPRDVADMIAKDIYMAHIATHQEQLREQVVWAWKALVSESCSSVKMAFVRGLGSLPYK